MTTRHVTLGVIGTGTASTNLVLDSLVDHFELGPADADGCYAPSTTFRIHPVLPVGAEYSTDALVDVWDWMMRADLPFTALYNGAPGGRSEEILASVLREEDIRTVAIVSEALIDALVAGPNPLLLVLSEDGALDAEAQETAANCLRADIPVYDLSRAMLEIGWRDLPDHEAPPEPEVTEQPGGQLALVVGDGPDVVLSASEAQQVREALTMMESVLYLLTTDVASYATSAGAKVLAARAALAPKSEPAEGKATGKKSLEVFDPETNSWRPAGRGRPRKGVQTRYVTR
ncbi:hypothetical protein [Saccharothrix sp. ST-888]|uniref:hypothetical protein n=1 Tax=Saccharothrix sp. ST-888 TaxID=1427391 RepID=UPI0005ED4169|nr:hypothetical protein [Saccharothrix sp. ST-888]KJK55530.1 hypothetical protein UK12_28100 [Saccharothrix sp. ST-888]